VTAGPELRLTFAEELDGSIRELISSLLRDWAIPGTETAKVTKLAGGASNINVRIDGEAESWALRLCMPDAERWGVDRAAAIQAMVNSSEIGVCPRLVAHKLPEGHYLSEFAVSQMLTKDMLRSQDLIPKVAETLRLLHTAPITGHDFSPFEDMRTFLELGAAEGAAQPAGLDANLARAVRVEALFKNRRAPRAFCHSDHVPQNWLWVDDAFKLVDWDYAGNGWIAFELASFACQAELTADETEYLLTSYDPEVDDGGRARVELMRFIAGVREATWAVMAEPILGGQTKPAEGWTYQGYAASNLAQAEAVVAHGFDELMSAARHVREGALI